MWRHELNGNRHQLTGYALGVIIGSQAEATRTSAIRQIRTFGQSEGKPESGHLALGHNVSVAPYLDASTPTRHLFMGFRRAYLLSRDRS